MDPALRFEAVSFGFGATTLLSDATFDVAKTGTTVIMGPAGVGKSTLLRMLARRAQMAPSFWHRGSVYIEDRDVLTELSLDEARHVVSLFGQKGRLHTASVIDNLVAACPSPLSVKEKRERADFLIERFELGSEVRDVLEHPVASVPLGVQRSVAIARSCSLEPSVLLVDEPTRDITEREAETLERLLAREAERRAILMVTHDQQLARRMGRRLILLVAGRVFTVADCPEFFEREPEDQVIASFLRTGNCWAEPRNTRVGPLTLRCAPSGFHWVVEGLLGGMARPGLMRELDEDLSALRSLSVNTVVSLEEGNTLLSPLRGVGVDVEHLPIADMHAPSLESAWPVLERTRARMSQKLSTVFHCKAGLGRTGMMLAACLVHSGVSPLVALDEVRAVCPRYVQSETQIEFLSVLASYRDARLAAQGSQV